MTYFNEDFELESRRIENDIVHSWNRVGTENIINYLNAKDYLGC